MKAQAKLYVSIRSPYSYLGLEKLARLLPEQNTDIELEICPVLPIAVRRPELFRQRSPRAIRYLEMDCRRIAEQNGIPFRIWPKPDPIVQDMETLEIAPEQPHIHRLVRLMQYAVEQGAGWAFIPGLARLIWDGQTDDWHLGEHVARVASEAGLDLSRMDAAIRADPEHYDVLTAANERALHEAGHWGVPTIVYEGEPFFGQDRIEAFLWRVNNPRG